MGLKVYLTLYPIMQRVWAWSGPHPPPLEGKDEHKNDQGGFEGLEWDFG